MLNSAWRAILIVAIGFAGDVDAARADGSPSNEDLRNIRAIADPQLSPDGRQLLLQVTDSTADGARTHVWLIDTGQGAARQLTFTPAGATTGEHDARWMPDGKGIVFLANRTGQTRLFALTIGASSPGGNNGGADAAAAVAADDLPSDVDGYAIAPDGKGIAVVAREPETAAESAARDRKSDAVRVDHAVHGKRLYLLRMPGGHFTAAAVEPDVASMSWSSDSRHLVVVTDGPNNAGDLGPARRAWMVQADDAGHAAPLSGLPPTIGAGAWAHDGMHYYFLAQSVADAPPGYSDLYSLDTASGAVGNLSAGLDASVINEPPIPDGDGVLQRIQHGTRATYVRVSGGERRLIDFQLPVVSQLASNPRRTGWVWIGSGPMQPDALYFAAYPGGAARRLAAPDILPRPMELPPSHLLRWRSDGAEVEGLLYLPASSPGRKIPLVVDVHEGPTNAWLDGFSAMNAFLVAQGWAVLRPNPRGSTGYGAGFAAANRNDLGGGDYRDIMAGVDAVVARYPIATDRMALIGYSYGGEIAGFAECRTNRFKAIVSGAPVIDQFSEYGTEDSSWYDRWFFGKPWERFDDLWRQSPLACVAHAKTPFLLLQGLDDQIDPPGQSREMYRALRQQGVDVELVEYPREDHYPLYYALYGLPSPEPWHGFDARERMVDFIGAAFDKAGEARE
jgi:dipeptidyl aminopeptidase/acylaminoacyl peptidase